MEFSLQAKTEKKKVKQNDGYLVKKRKKIGDGSFYTKLLDLIFVTSIQL